MCFFSKYIAYLSLTDTKLKVILSPSSTYKPVVSPPPEESEEEMLRKAIEESKKTFDQEKKVRTSIDRHPKVVLQSIDSSIKDKVEGQKSKPLKERTIFYLGE